MQEPHRTIPPYYHTLFLKRFLAVAFHFLGLLCLGCLSGILYKLAASQKTCNVQGFRSKTDSIIEREFGPISTNALDYDEVFKPHSVPPKYAWRRHSSG